jgi:hypothetical protein
MNNSHLKVLFFFLASNNNSQNNEKDNKTPTKHDCPITHRFIIVVLITHNIIPFWFSLDDYSL